MKNSKTKGFLYFAFFILAILLIGLISGFREGDPFKVFSNQLNKIQKSLGINKQKQPYSSDYITQRIVQEDSQVIDAVDRVSPAVVSVVVKTVDFDFFYGPTSAESGIGTGFIVDKGGLIITNSHVVNSVGGDYSVILKDGTSYEVDKIHLDEQNDLAILEIAARDLPTVTFGDSDKLKVGQKAIAIGNALGQFQNTVTVGVVSGVGRSIVTGDGFSMEQKTYENVIQTDAAVNPGNSGGPLLDIAGQVIGINVATSSGADNISFAIPINTLKPVLESFIKEGRIIKPYLGVSYTMISKEIAALRRLSEGAFVSHVADATPAHEAGLQRGDIITKLNGKNLSTTYSLSQAILGQKVGDEVILEVDREGKILEIKATLAEIPQSQNP